MKHIKDGRMKLIKTDLLKKYGHNSDVGIATASHLAYCQYCYKGLKGDYELKAIFGIFIELLERIAYLVLAPFFILTHGLILYPVWIILHISRTKKIIKKYGIEHINTYAKKLVEECKK